MTIGISWEQEYLRWKSRGKRTRRQPEPNSDTDSDDISAAAEALVLLANSNGGFCSAAKMIKSAPTSLPHIDSTTNFHIKKHQELTSATAAVDDWFKKDKPKSPDTPLLLGAHDCWECGKIFKSHQALGGHMRMHSRKVETTTAAVSVSGRIHECSVCHEQFSTGQALGGHKRKHYDVGLIANKKAKKAYESESISHCGGRDNDSGGGATTHVARVLGIDLNMPPPMEEFDDEEVQFDLKL